MCTMELDLYRKNGKGQFLLLFTFVFQYNNENENHKQICDLHYKNIMQNLISTPRRQKTWKTLLVVYFDDMI